MKKLNSVWKNRKCVFYVWRYVLELYIRLGETTDQDIKIEPYMKNYMNHVIYIMQVQEMKSMTSNNTYIPPTSELLRRFSHCQCSGQHCQNPRR